MSPQMSQDEDIATEVCSIKKCMFLVILCFTLLLYTGSHQGRNVQLFHAADTDMSVNEAEPANGMSMGTTTLAARNYITPLQGRHARSSGAISSTYCLSMDAEATASAPLLPAPSTTADGLQPSQTSARELSDAIVVGLINTIVAVPGTLAYVAIMFPSPRFRPFIPSLSRLVLLGSAIHQGTCSCISSLPFAIGQVQDAGLIFFSAMSTSVASLLPVSGESKEEREATERLMVTTTLLAMTLSTAITGALLILVGKRKLAGLIAYIPLPVVAGYLGYVGYFCLAAGAAQASGKPVASLPSWVHILAPDAWQQTLAGFGSFAFMYATLRNWRHPLCMPTVLCLVPVLYYTVLFGVTVATGKTWGQLFQELGEAGWVTPAEAGSAHARFWGVYELYDLLPWRADRVAWGVLARQVPMTLALFSAVLFGSSLDVTAIQASLPYEVDCNAQIVTLGISNLLAGVCGVGFTGSYIFSQTVFTIRTGCTHRLNGAVVAAAEAALFLVPVPVIQLLPNFYYGALLLVFGVEITMDWLVLPYSRFTRMEYALTLAVFAVIMVTTAKLKVTGLEVGVAVGIVVCLLHFAVEYSNVQVRALTAIESISPCVRPYQQRAVLELFDTHIKAVSLSGYAFFGSSVLLGDRVCELARAVAAAAKDADAHLAAALAEFPTANTPGSTCAAEWAADSHLSGLDLTRLSPALRAAHRFLLLDFAGVSAIDATAAATFKKMSLASAACGVVLVIIGVPRPSARWSLLVGNGVVARDGGHGAPGAADDTPYGTCPCFDALEDALAWCEAHFLQVAVQERLMPSGGVMRLEEVVDMHLGPWMRAQPSRGMLPGLSAADVAEGLQRFGEILQLRAGETLYAAGDDAAAMYIVLDGKIMCKWDSDAFRREPKVFASLQPSATETTQIGTPPALPPPRRRGAVRCFRYYAGAVMGDLDFFRRQQRSFGAVCTRDAAALRLPAEGYRRMLVEAPLVAVMLQHMVIQNEMHCAASHIKVEHARQSAAGVG